jgi:DNA-directed RNA polymerase II subunit RPB2
MLPTEYPSEKEGSIDDGIATNAMMTLIHAEMRAEKFAGPQLNSMNSFYETGLPQIATSVFALNGRMRSERNDTGVDAGIVEIEFDVEFRNVTLQPPTVSKYLTGQPELLTPNMAMTNGSTYSAQMSLDAVLHAKAYYKDGHTVERTAEVKNQRIAGIPCMVGSRMCNTYRCSKETLKQLEQDPNDPGGIFICKGGAWSVDNLENLTANMPHCYIQKYEDEAVRMLVLSKPGDAFENSYQTILRLRHSGSLTIDTTMKKNDNTMQIPFYIIFRALGVCSDKEIANHIVYGVDRLDAVGQNMMRVVERAFTFEDPKFAEIRKEMHSATIIDWLSAKMIEVANASAARRDDNVQKYMHAQAMNTFDKYLFPHVGTKPEDRPRKLRYLGHLLNRLISVHLGITDQTDRDSYKSKRVHSAGATIAKTFKTHYNLAFVQVIKKRLMQDFKTTPFSHVPLERVFTHAANTDALENALVQSIVSGEKFTGTRQLKVKNRISSQSVYLKNDMNLKSTLRVVNTPDANMGSKGTDRADVMRRVHPTYVGYIDVSQSADTGVKVGMTKQLAVTASVCGATSSFNLRKVLLSNTDIIPLMDVPLDTIVTEKLSKVFVNGDWIGCCRESHNLVQRYRVARRHGHIHHLVTIVWEPKSREIYFWTDMGRLMRPLVIVYNNMAEYVEAVRGGDKTFKFKQWIKLTAEHLRKLQARELTMEDLRKERVVEYISPEEQESTYLATSIDDLRKHVNDLHYRYTHCDIPQAILGIVSLGAPMAAMSNTTRNTYFTNHRKQSAGWFALNYPFRIDKNVTLQHYCEQPLVSTFSDAWTYPNGHNAIVALMLHGGKNMEDSIEANQSSIDCGLYNASFYSYEKAELEKGEKMGNPDRARTMDIKKDSVYDSIEDGLVREGTLLTKNTVMISKFATLPQPVGDYRYTDKSVIYKKEEPVRVERSMIVRNESDAQVCKVKFRSDRPLAVGDKLCLHPSHKVMTTLGWIPVADVTLDHLVACYDDTTKTFRYCNPTALQSYDHNGNLYEVKSQQVNQLVTKNHKMYVRERKAHGFHPFKLLEAQNIFGKQVRYKKDAASEFPDILIHTVVLADGTTSSYPMDAWLDMLGIFISDGWVRNDNERTVVFSATKQRKVDHINRFAESLGGLDVTHSADKHYVCDHGLHVGLKHLSVGAVNKFLPDYVWNLGARQARVLLDSLLSGDGHVKPTGGESYSTSSLRLAEDVVRLALHAGCSANITVGAEAGYHSVLKNGKEITSLHTSYRVGVVRTKNEPRVNHGRLPVGVKQDKYVHYEGKVYCLTVPTGIFYTMRDHTPSWTGNSSRTGNKGICAAKCPRMDMPYALDGLTPDLLVNAHSIPTRMALNQITECMFGMVALLTGTHYDATTFRENDIDGAIALLAKHGIKYGGAKRLYNGRTGCWIDTLIFMGPTTYQRLQKYVEDEHYATRFGPTAALTHQPLDGKAKDGGLRLGEMEAWVLVAHGAGRLLSAKTTTDSDAFTLPVCRVCGQRCIVNEKLSMYKCKTCGDAADIVGVPSTWCANLFTSMAQGMNVKMDFAIEPFKYAQAAAKREQ